MSLVKVSSNTADTQEATDFDLCFICQNSTLSKSIVENTGLESIKKALSCARQRSEYNDNDNLVVALSKQIGNLNEHILTDNNGFYHRKYFSNITNSEKVRRAEKRFRSALGQTSTSRIKPKVGRPSLTVSTEDIAEENILRSQHVLYDNNLCIVWRSPSQG